MKTKKFLIFILALVIVLPLVLASCGDEKDQTSSAASNAEVNQDEKFTEDTGLESKNWGGKTVKFLTLGGDTGFYNRELGSTQIQADPNLKDYYNGEQVYEAVLKREREIEDKYGIKVEVYFSAQGETPASMLDKQLQGGDCDYDVYCDTLLRTASDMGLKGQLLELSNLGIDFSKSFWDQSAINDLSINHNLYFVTGDAIVSDDQATWCCFFNKDIVNEYGLDNPYELVEDNKWTIDKLYEMGKAYSYDYNLGLSEITYENGHFGLITQTYDGITTMCAMNQRLIGKNADDMPVYNKSQDLEDRFAKTFDLLKDGTNSLIAEFITPGWSEDDYKNADSAFIDGRALFEFNKVEKVFTFAQQSKTVNFGILPMPKYSEDQDNYHSTCTVYWSLFMSVPKNLPKDRYEIVGYTLQLMGYYGQKYLTPAYYDITLKLQKTPEEIDEKMLDKVFESRVFDLGSVFQNDYAIQLYTGVICGTDNTLHSKLDGGDGPIQITIDQIIEAFGD